MRSFDKHVAKFNYMPHAGSSVFHTHRHTYLQRSQIFTVTRTHAAARWKLRGKSSQWTKRTRPIVSQTERTTQLCNRPANN